MASKFETCELWFTGSRSFPIACRISRYEFFGRFGFVLLGYGIPCSGVSACCIRLIIRGVFTFRNVGQCPVAVTVAYAVLTVPFPSLPIICMCTGFRDLRCKVRRVCVCGSRCLRLALHHILGWLVIPADVAFNRARISQRFTLSIYVEPFRVVHRLVVRSWEGMEPTHAPPSLPSTSQM
jgi:hypothetical protein